MLIAAVVAVFVGATTLLGQKTIDDNRSEHETRLSEEQSNRADRLEDLRFVRERASIENAADRAFSNMDLREMNLSGLQLSAADLREAKLNKAELVEATLAEGTLEGADLTGAHLDHAELNSVDIHGAKLNGAILVEADLSCELTGPPKLPYHKKSCHDRYTQHGHSHTYAASAELNNISAHEADLSGADLHDAKLNGADLRGATLEEVGLTAVEANRARLECISEPVEDNPGVPTEPRCTDMTGSVLFSSDFRNANLSGAKLHWVTIDGKTDFSGAKFDGTRFSDICYESTTKWPEGFYPIPARTQSCYTDESLKSEIQSSFGKANGSTRADLDILAPKCRVTAHPWAWVRQMKSAMSVVAQDLPAWRIKTVVSAENDSANRRLGALVERPNSAAPREYWVWLSETQRWHYDPC